jgi:hypothetical protein
MALFPLFVFMCVISMILRTDLIWNEWRINVLKNGDIVYICNIKKNCTKSITTDSESVAIIKAKNQYVCGYDPTVRKTEAKQLRIRSRKNSGDVSKRQLTFVG